MEEKIEKISKIDKATSTGDSLAGMENLERLPPNKSHFDSLVHSNEQPSKKTINVSSESKGSLMDEVRILNQRVDHFGRVNTKDLATQADKVVNEIESIKTKLTSSNLDLKPETQTMLQNKLQHIDENLRVALSKAGLEYNPQAQLEDKSVNPIERFFSYLTSSQAALNSLSGELGAMGLNNREITPANMLRIQLKVSYITQEVEFFTAVLNKALDSTKTIMNVQV